MYVCSKCYATLDAGERQCPICGGTAVRSSRPGGSVMHNPVKTEKRKYIYYVKEIGTGKILYEFDNLTDAAKAEEKNANSYLDMSLQITKISTA